MNTSDLVLKTLREAGKPLKSKEIADLSRVEKAEIDKAIKQLKKEERLISPKACYYEPK
jgi:transcription initiation factor TFIIIB Brf1 subunit/transcription initiation factor TFIIB